MTKIQSTHKKLKSVFIQRKKTTIETISEKDQLADILEKDFKTTVSKSQSTKRRHGES